MHIKKELKAYLSGLFTCKSKDIFYKRIDECCFMLAKVYKEKNYTSWDSDYKNCTVNNGMNFYDIRFCIVLNSNDAFKPSDYNPDYSLCAVCGKTFSEWAVSADIESSHLLQEIKECFKSKCYSPVFEEGIDLYDWTKAVVLSVYDKEKIMIDEMYFMYDLADYCNKDEEKMYWDDCIKHLINK